MACGMSPTDLDALLLAALKEDAPFGDLTTGLLGFADLRAAAVFLAKERLVVCGLPAAVRVFELADARCEASALLPEGQAANAGDILGRIEGPLEAVLLAERTALNLLQRLSGIATLTRDAVEEIRGTAARLLDTRKTTPGLRLLEKYAVRTGGATNHRTGLSDGILIKDNHIAGAGSIAEAVRRARSAAGALWRVEVEAKSLEEFRDAVGAGAEVILLDNMDPETMAQAVRERPPGVLLEASGGLKPGGLRRVAETGVDYLSVGALTHSARAVDISLEIEPA